MPISNTNRPSCRRAHVRSATHNMFMNTPISEVNLPVSKHALLSNGKVLLCPPHTLYKHACF